MTRSITGRSARFLASTACAAVLALCAVPAAAQYTLSEGTQINAVLASDDIDTKSAQVGDAFTMNIVTPYPNGDANLAGAVIRGHVSEVTKAGQGKAAGLRLAFDSIVFPNGESASLSGTVTSTTLAKPENTTTRKGLAAAVGAAIGSQTVGRIIGGAAGSVVGLLGGAAGGFLYANNDKPNLDLARGTTISIQTTANVEIPRRQAAQ
jgi:hypothetical protein